MDVTHCLQPSQVLSMSLLLLLLLLFAAVGSADKTRSAANNIPLMISGSRSSHQMQRGISQQEKSSVSLSRVATTPAPLHPPTEANADRWETRMIQTQNRRTFMGLAALWRESSLSQIEVLTDEIPETVWRSSQAGPPRHRREATDTEATTKDPHAPGNSTPSYSTSSSSYNTSTTLPDDLQSNMSTVNNMYLCEHPPKAFSPTFLGSSYKPCLQYKWKKVITFRSTMKLCNTIYSLVETNPVAPKFGMVRLKDKIFKVIAHESFVRVCLPLFRRFNKCEERDFLTICLEDRVVFYHSNKCPHSSDGIFLATFLLGNNTSCFREFCEGRQRLVYSELRGLHYRLTNTRYSTKNPSCTSVSRRLKYILSKSNGTLYMLFNNHWPCCYAFYMVIWAGLPEAHGLNGAWSYLPAACQTGEILLVVLVGCVMVGSIGGNLLVLVVMLRGGHRGQESSLFRTSLALTDLLTATFVITPSFVQHVSPFLYPPDYITVTPSLSANQEHGHVLWHEDVSEGFNKRTGFPVFQSILFYTTSTASQLMLLMLSVERFVITGRYLRYKDYFSYSRTVLAIAASWTTSLVTAFWFAAHSKGGLAAQWLIFEKLPTGASGYGPGGVRNVIYHGQFVLFVMLGISIVTFSMLAMRNFVKEQIHVAREWRSLKMRPSKHYSRDNRYVLTTMTLMFVLFLTSTIPLSTHIFFNSISYSLNQHPLFSYLAWWLFMSACAWNPWIYNFRSHQFKEDLRDFKHQVLRAWRRRGRQRQPSEEVPQPLPDTTLPTQSSWVVAADKTE